MKYLLLCILLLAGCAQTTGKETKIENYFYIHGNTDTRVEISPLVEQQSKTGAISDLKATNTPNVPVEITVPLTKSTPAGIIKDAVAGDVLVEVIESVKPDVTVGQSKDKPKEPGKVDDLANSTETLETRYHHTTTGSSDGGKSLVLCPGQTMDFDKCSSSGVAIPKHGFDTGRVIYWNMHEVPVGDIVCTKGDKTYRYPADKTIVYGSCQ